MTKTAQVQSLDQFNQALAVAGVNLSAVITGTDSLTFTSTNDGAGQVITGTAAPAAPATLDAINISANAAGGGAGGAVVPAVPDPVSQNARATLVSQYNLIIQQIATTAQDSSFNGINLLDGNSLKLIFDETGKSTLTIAGVTFNPAGLGLASLNAGSDFTDNVLTGKVLTALNTASTELRSQASAFGANLSIVEIRQDFSKKLINVLQTGSSNLTLANSNEEAANSQALSTRQSIAVSALALAKPRSRASFSSCADFIDAGLVSGDLSMTFAAAGLLPRRFFTSLFAKTPMRGATTAGSCPSGTLCRADAANKNGGAKAPPFWFVEGFAAISAGAAERSAATGWRAPARRSQSTGGSTAPGCWPLPRWSRPASGWTSRSATR